ncbi:MAG: alpha/beta fold hydrolase [Solirubrobacterales bacterium]
MRRVSAGILAACVAAAIGAAPASALDKVVTIGSDGPGPAAYDKVYVHQMGPKKADRVLVLMPGTQGGAGDFTLLAEDLIDRVGGIQVWSIDRRSQALEDTSVFARALSGEITLQEMFDYYLGWTVNGGTPADHFGFLDADTVPFAREWGMRTALEDARKVVLAAGRKAREVILGGHSLGASLTAAYAAWDFNGKPGYEDVDGLVLIDGGLLGSFDAYDLAQAQQQIADLQTSNPFIDLLGIGFPEAAGLFAEVGGAYARLDGAAPATTIQNFPLLPDAFRPPFPVTNRALFGHAFDRDTSPEALGLLHVNAGALAATGDPRDWTDGGVTPITRLAETFGQEPSNATEWYFPKRLTIDTNGANQMKMNDVARFLGLRLKHTNQIDVPIYAFQTDLTDGGVLRGARALVKRAKTTKGEAMLVNGAPQQSHLDPLTAAPERSKFFKKLIGFLGAAG